MRTLPISLSLDKHAFSFYTFCITVVVPVRERIIRSAGFLQTTEKKIELKFNILCKFHIKIQTFVENTQQAVLVS